MHVYRLPHLLLAAVTLVAGWQWLDLPYAATIIDDFEQYAPGDVPGEWQMLDGRTLRPLSRSDMNENEYFRILQVDGDRVLSTYTKGEAIRITRANGDGWEWNLDTQPCLGWDWRALRLPQGAREDKINDTGAAVYVTYSISKLGIPRSIKYTYSSTLPIGTVVSFRGLKVLVVASGVKQMNTWMRIERNVAEDYRRLWQGSPPDRPLAISLWSDSNSTNSEALVYFDDIEVLSSCEG